MPMLRKTEETPKAYSLTKMEVYSSNQSKNNVEIVDEKMKLCHQFVSGGFLSVLFHDIKLPRQECSEMSE